MRLGTTLFAALVLTVALANTAWAQAPRTYTGTYSVFGPYSSRASTGTYSVYGPYTDRYSSTPSATSTSIGSASSPWRTESITQTGSGSGQGDSATGLSPATDRALAPSRPRYVRLSFAGNAIQGIVVP
jgi:hypothetical protein